MSTHPDPFVPLPPSLDGIPPGPGGELRMSAAQKTTVALLSGCAFVVLLCLCCAGGLVVAGLSDVSQKQRVGIAGRNDGIEKRAETRARLESLRDTLLLRVEGLPEELPEGPPSDAWGNPVSWMRNSFRKGMLTSGGPDGRIGTDDDVQVEVSAD